MKKTTFTSMFRAALLLVTLLCSTRGAKAADFITDVMVIGNNDKTEFDKLQSDYEKEGWIAINKDLNSGCGSGSDYIHLLYKKQSSPGSSGKPITEFYISTGNIPITILPYENRIYNLLPCDGSTNFVNSQGDLNRGAGGDFIRLYYTKNPMPGYNAVTGITFDNTQSGAVGKNGETIGYDLNSGCGSGTAYIYMHVTVSRGPVELVDWTAELTLQDGDVLCGTGGKDTRVNIPSGTTVTLSGVDITAIPDDENHQWAGITCLGDAVIILADGTTNKVKGGRYSSGLFVPEGHILTISGNGSLNATGGSYGAGIGSGNGKDVKSCGNITIEGGNITATGGQRSAGIGSGYSSSCGNITIGEDITRISAITGEYAPTAIGQGIEGKCGTITIAQSLIDMTEGKTRTIWPGNANLGFYDDADNTASISSHADSKKYDIQLRGRTIYRDGTWNTLCLPFDLNDFTGTLLEGFTVMELDTKTAHDGHTTGFDPTDLTYHMNFKSATGIKAGVPYIVRCTSNKGSVTNPVFYGVTVKNVTPATVASTDGTVSFSGSFKPVSLGAFDHSKIFLGDNNTLHFPSANMNVGSFRASFQLAISLMGDVNDDGKVSLNDIFAIVNHILGIPNDNPNDIFIFERADLDNSKDISLADILLVVDIILNENQDNNVKVYTGSTPITYGSGGNGDRR